MAHIYVISFFAFPRIEYYLRPSARILIFTAYKHIEGEIIRIHCLYNRINFELYAYLEYVLEF